MGIASKRLPDSTGVETIEVSVKDLENAMKRLRTSQETQLDYLLTVSGVDSADTFDSVYHLWSYEDPSRELVVKVRIPKSELKPGKLPCVPSLSPFWEAANWHERETFDLVGIRYIGHPYPRRILNPWDWEGHPLRRDYKQPVDALNDKNPHSMR
jgi:NADH-quinone oxidoreductase subunit C